MRAKNAVASRKRRKKVLGRAKGARGDRSRKYRRAEETVRRGLVYAYRDRRNKKREFRSLWIVRLNGAVRELGMEYKEFIHKLKTNNILLSRDILAKIAAEEPEAFASLVEAIKN